MSKGGFSDLRFLQDIEKLVIDAAKRTLEEAGKLGEEKARNTTKFKNKGPLRAATNFHKVNDSSGFVLADKPYAHFLEDGNPYQGFQIVPKIAKVLHFKINGKDIFTTHSTAHGPYNFMKDAQEEVEKNIEAIFNQQFDKVLGGK